MTRPHETDESRFRRFPEPTALALDIGTRRTDGGRTFVGGSPMRLLRLSERGASVVDGWLSGRPIGASSSEQRLARRLVDAGVLHPVPDSRHRDLSGDLDVTVDVVVPVRDDVSVADTIIAVATGVRQTGVQPTGVRQIVVVDDHSADSAAVARAVAAAATDVSIPVRLERRRRRGGPGAARNTGWNVVDGDVVVFIDAGVVPEGAWLDVLLAHLRDEGVDAVAPRVVPRPGGGPSSLDAYERSRSPLDMGPHPARVAPGSRVSYVPTAALVMRRRALVDAGGFDERLRFGEDVDLVWRIVADGGDVRYEPRARVSHPNRSTWASVARQRFSYGSSAAQLDSSHPGALAPVAVNGWSLGSWALVALGGRRGAVVGSLCGVSSAAALVPRLRDRVDDPAAEAIRIGGVGHLRAGAALARTCLRPWMPVLAVAAVFSRRARRLCVGVAVGVPLAEWVSERPDLDPARWTLARLLDNAAYSAGVWSGCRTRRRWGPLLPKITTMPWLRSRDDHR